MCDLLPLSHFNVDEIREYAKSKGVYMVMHHEIHHLSETTSAT